MGARSEASEDGIRAKAVVKAMRQCRVRFLRVMLAMVRVRVRVKVRVWKIQSQVRVRSREHLLRVKAFVTELWYRQTTALKR